MDKLPDIQELQKDIEILMERILGGKPDPKLLLIMAQHLNLHPVEDIDVKSLFQSIKRDNKINEILGE